MRNRRFLFVLMILAGAGSLSLPAAEACSICHCGDPTYSLVGSQIFVPNTWSVGLDADRYSKDQVSEEDPSQREQEDESRITFSAAYSIRRRLTLIARLPIADRTISTDSESQSMTGLSDPEFVVHVNALPSRPATFLSASLGVRTGWGENNRQVDGERAEEHLQPGTGAVGLNGGVSFSRLLDVNGTIFGSVLGRANGRNDFGYKYGDAVLANIAYERRLAGPLNGVFEVNYRTAGKDEEQVGEKDPNTGGTVLYLSPRILVRLDKSQGLYFRLGVQIPVVENLFGDQDEKVNVLTGLTFRF
jgi:hypothetical protein